MFANLNISNDEHIYSSIFDSNDGNSGRESVQYNKQIITFGSNRNSQINDENNSKWIEYWNW